jgi:predicted nucleic acid-binding Zn ribbon protein
MVPVEDAVLVPSKERLEEIQRLADILSNRKGQLLQERRKRHEERLKNQSPSEGRYFGSPDFYGPYAQFMSMAMGMGNQHSPLKDLFPDPPRSTRECPYCKKPATPGYSYCSAQCKDMHENSEFQRAEKTKAKKLRQAVAKKSRRRKKK